MSEQKSEGIKYKLKKSGIDCIVFPGDELYEEVRKLYDDKKELVIEDKKFFTGTEPLRKESMPQWNYTVGISKAFEKAKTFSLPQKPQTFGKDYDFPEDITGISSMSLGQWLFKLAAWKGYALRVLALSETESVVMEATYDTTIAKNLSELEIDKKLHTKEALIGKIISSNEQIKNLRIKLIEKKGEVVSLKRIVELYTMQLDVISREISRRDQDIRLMQKGVIRE